MATKDKIEAARQAIEVAESTLIGPEHSSLLQALEAQNRLLEAIDALIGEREEVVRNIAAFKRVLTIGTDGAHWVAAPTIVEGIPPRAGLAALVVWKQAEAVLREVGKPMTSGAIAREIRARGGNPGKHPTAGVANGIKRYLGRVFTQRREDGGVLYGLCEWEGKNSGLKLGG